MVRLEDEFSKQFNRMNINSLIIQRVTQCSDCRVILLTFFGIVKNFAYYKIQVLLRRREYVFISKLPIQTQRLLTRRRSLLS